MFPLIFHSFGVRLIDKHLQKTNMCMPMEELYMLEMKPQPGGVSDGNFVSAEGTPTIDGMGPTGGMMCSPEEFLEISTMVPCGSRLALTIMKLGKP